MLPGGSLVAQMVKRLPAMQESQVRFLARLDDNRTHNASLKEVGMGVLFRLPPERGP